MPRHSMSGDDPGARSRETPRDHRFAADRPRHESTERRRSAKGRTRSRKVWWLTVAAFVIAPLVAGGVAVAAIGGPFINFRVASPVSVQALGIDNEHPAVGQTVTAGAKVVAESQVTLDTVVLAVVDQSGRRFDFPQSRRWSLGTTQQVYSATRAFDRAGTYTYWFAYKKNGRWTKAGPRQTFTVGNVTNPTPTPTAGPSTPAPTPSSTPTTPVPTTTHPVPTTTTPVPQPSTSTPSSSQTGCASDPSKCGYPDADNTGVPAGTALTVVSGTMSITTPGAVVQNKEIRGCVEVRATNVTIKNSRIVGNGCYNAVRNFSTGLTISDTEITCGNTAGNGITANYYTLLRVDISGCENGLNVAGNVTMTDSYIHNLYYASGAHTDGAQFNQGAGNIIFRHNSILSPVIGTSAIIMWDETNPQNHDVSITGNLLAGGGYTLYCPRYNSTNVQITNNRFGAYNFGPANSCIPGHVAAFTGNVYDATGKAL